MVLILAALAVSGAAVGLTLNHLLTNALGRHGPLDLRVYVHGARAIRAGSALYGPGFSAAAPNHLPFTYPPFAAIVLVPLSYIALGRLAWGWDILSGLVLAGCVWVAFRSLSQRLGERLGQRLGRTVAVVVITSVALLARPVYDDLVFGQVDILLMGACIFACVSRSSRPGRATLVGLAAAIKVVPGIFIIYLILTRRWRMAGAALAAWAAATGLGFVLRPSASVAYYGHLLWKTGRPGNPTFFINQSAWGMLDRLDLGHWRIPTIAAAVGVLGVVGLGRAVATWRQGDPVTAVVLVGLVGVLTSPISWIHETVWLIPAVGVLVCNALGRSPARRVLGVVLVALLCASLPYVGNDLGHPSWGLAQVLMDTYGLAAAALVLAGLGISRDARRGGEASAADVPVPDREAAVGDRAEGVRGVAPLDQAPAAL